MLPLFLVVVPSQELHLPLPVYWKLWNISAMLLQKVISSNREEIPPPFEWSQSHVSITTKKHQEWIGNIHCFNQYHLFTSVFIHQNHVDYLSVCLWVCLTLCQNLSSNFFCYESYVCFLSHSCDPLEFL